MELIDRLSLLQLCSSEPSLQSLLWSHIQARGTHCPSPFLQAYSSGEQVRASIKVDVHFKRNIKGEGIKLSWLCSHTYIDITINSFITQDFLWHPKRLKGKYMFKYSIRFRRGFIYGSDVLEVPRTQSNVANKNYCFDQIP